MIQRIIKKAIPPLFLSCYHLFLAFLGAVIFGFPSRKMKIIGITGTNGKSTVIDLTTRVLEEADLKVASISSIRFKIDKKEWQNELKMTMPGRISLQRFLFKAKRAGCQYVVLEVTSEGIKQHRHRFIDFDVALITNLKPEHIEAHGSFEKYRKAKAKLFQGLTNVQRSGSDIKDKKVSIVNLDDENADYFLQFPADEKWGYGIKAQSPKPPSARGPQDEGKIQNFIRAIDTKTSINGIFFKVRDVEFRLKLLGEFNVYNSLAAICVGLSQGISLESIKTSLEKAERIPGRMEEVVKQPFKVFVDYAHTPDALESVYTTLSSAKIQNPNSKLQISSKSQTPKLICVLGSCGGGRDKWKRPLMGKIAAQYCGKIILTNEDPYNENPLQIIKDIESGFSQAQSSPARIAMPARSRYSVSGERSIAGRPARIAMPARSRYSVSGGRSIAGRKPKAQNYEKILDRREAISKALGLAKAGDTVIITGKGSEPWMCVAGNKKIAWDDRKMVREELEKLEFTP